MPVTIQTKPPSSFSDPIGLLGDCHRRIEFFLSILARVSDQGRGNMMTKEMRDAWRRALDYFRDAAPHHVADEEESLFPRLRLVDQQSARKALGRVSELEADHSRAAEWHTEVEQLGRRWLADGQLGTEEGTKLAESLMRLQELYVRHISIEDSEVFPVAASVLPPSDLADVGREMEQRRGLAAQRQARFADAGK